MEGSCAETCEHTHAGVLCRSLVGCPNCGRTFTPEALAHHAKACTVGKPMKGPGGAVINLTATAASGPAATGYMCYLCGLTAPAALLPTHVPQCQVQRELLVTVMMEVATQKKVFVPK